MRQHDVGRPSAGAVTDQDTERGRAFAGLFLRQKPVAGDAIKGRGRYGIAERNRHCLFGRHIEAPHDQQAPTLCLVWPPCFIKVFQIMYYARARYGDTEIILLVRARHPEGGMRRVIGVGDTDLAREIAVWLARDGVGDSLVDVRIEFAIGDILIVHPEIISPIRA